MTSYNFAEIQGYTDSCRTTHLNQNKGLQNLLLLQDGNNGRLISTAPSGKLIGGSDGRYVSIGSDQHLITQCIVAIYGDNNGVPTDVPCDTI